MIDKCYGIRYLYLLQLMATQKSEAVNSLNRIGNVYFGFPYRA